MRATTWFGPLLILPALAGTPRVAPLSAQDARLYRIDRVTVQQTGARVFVHVTADGVASSLGEPQILTDRTRLSLTLLRTTLGRPMPIQPLHDNGLLDTRLEQRGDDVVLTIDAASIGEYGLEPRAGGVVLWFEPAPAPVAPNTAALDSLLGAALADAGVTAAAAASRTTSGAAATVAASVPDQSAAATGRTLRAGASGFLLGIVAIAQDNLDAVLRDRGVLALALPGAAVALLLLTMALWLARARRQREPEPEAAPVSTGEAFAWAARTLRSEGFDVGGIAQRTGIARDAVQLLLETMDPANPAASGSTFRPAASQPGGARVPPTPISH